MSAPAFIAPMATLAELKARLSYPTTIESEYDDTLNEILLGTSAEIEREARRQLRRIHSHTEIHTGGGRLIRLRHFPVANIESIRISETRDFETAANYEELVEGEDYIIDPEGGDGAESGIVRRIDARWEGNEDRPGLIQVIYTGGYKTERERELENQTTTINEQSRIQDFGVSGSGTDDLFSNEDGGEIIYGSTGTFACIRFDIAGLILPSWIISSAVATISVKRSGGNNSVSTSKIITSLDPIASTAKNIYNAIAAATTQAWDAQHEAFDDNFTSEPTSEASAAITAALQLGLKEGHISIGLLVGSGGPQAILAGKEQSSPALRPSLEVRHRQAIVDPYNMPDDLRSACLTQSVHEFQYRKNPGEMQQAMRGITVASGSLSMKQPMALLPSVRDVARSYRRMY